MKRAWVSLGAGFLASVGLALLEAANRHSQVWILLLFPGYLTSALIWGVHAGEFFFEAVMVVVNAFIYGLLVLIFLRVANWMQTK